MISKFFNVVGSVAASYCPTDKDVLIAMQFVFRAMLCNIVKLNYDNFSTLIFFTLYNGKCW